MSVIKILPEILSNKIAAGEVVERPFSVVKELVENAIDAKSARIRIEVEKGGRSLIRVADDGVGMSHDDAILAVERYATSKIYTDRDLFSIQTLGFRGEALPSIAAVSRLRLITRDEDSDSGTEVIVEGGKIVRVSEVGAPKGAMIEVKNLFFNTPARRKFLKTVETEMGHIADIVSGMALGNPDIRFKLTHNGKVVCNYAFSSDPKSRAIEVLGKEAGTFLYPVALTRNNVAISGWAASDRHTRSTGRGMYFFVNKRPVRDKIISHALLEGYSGRLMKGRFPVAVIFIDLAPEQVDVNVHPTKHEVRFADSKLVHDAVARAVSDAVGSSAAPLGWASVGETFSTLETRFSVTDPEREMPVEKPFLDFNSGSGQRLRPMGREKEIREQQVLWDKRFFSDLSVIGQFRNTYILCQSDDGLVLIDQHAAHERILYEEIKNKSFSRQAGRQRLLIPETFDLGYRDAQILSGLTKDLEAAGIEVEPFGENTFVLKAVPGLLADREVKPLIMEIVEKTMETGLAANPEKAMDECYKIMACHGAIRANQALSDRQILELLNQLDRCENPDNCPHGRPTWIRWDVTDLEKKFSRIV